MMASLVPVEISKSTEPEVDDCITFMVATIEQPQTSGKSWHSMKKYSSDKNSEEYQKRRQRNNVAVRKSRDKSRMKTQQTLSKINELKAENAKLESKVQLLSKELSVLKDLFLSHAEELPDPSTTFGLFNSGATSKLVSETSVADNTGSKLIVANTIELSMDGRKVTTIMTEGSQPMQIPLETLSALSALTNLGKQVIIASEASG